MKVQFKLNKEQLSRARKIEQEKRAEVYKIMRNGFLFDGSDCWGNRDCELITNYDKTGGICGFEFGQSSVAWMGNLLGMMEEHTFDFNNNQRLGLSGNTVTYIGERCPMRQDGALDIIVRIFNEKAENIKPERYKTSIKEMMWCDDALSFLRRIKKTKGALMAIYYAICVLNLNADHATLRYFNWDISESERSNIKRLSENDRVLNASFSSSQREYMAIDTLKQKKYYREHALIVLNDKYCY